MYYDYAEITPHNKKGDFRFNKNNEKVVKFASNEVEARALIEGQFMAKRLHVEKMGFSTGLLLPILKSLFGVGLFPRQF